LNVGAFLGFAADIHCVARRRGVRSPLSKSRNSLSVSNSFFSISCCAECAEMTHLSVSAIGEATILLPRSASVLILVTESLVCRWSRAAILLSNCDESVERALSACTNSRLKILAIFHVDFEHRLAPHFDLVRLLFGVRLGLCVAVTVAFAVIYCFLGAVPLSSAI